MSVAFKSQKNTMKYLCPENRTAKNDLSTVAVESGNHGNRSRTKSTAEYVNFYAR